MRALANIEPQLGSDCAVRVETYRRGNIRAPCVGHVGYFGRFELRDDEPIKPRQAQYASQRLPVP